MKDFYCDEVFSGKTPVVKVFETDNVLAFHHTKPHWPIHIVVVPKKHICSLLELRPNDDALAVELLDVIKKVASKITKQHGACRIITHLGEYQDSKHLHFHVSAGEPIKK